MKTTKDDFYGEVKKLAEIIKKKKNKEEDKNGTGSRYKNRIP